MTRRTRRHRRTTLVVLIASVWAAAMLVAVVILIGQGVEKASKWASVLGSLTALAGFSAPIVERVIARTGDRRTGGRADPDGAALRRGADDLALAVQAQWREEARTRRLQDPWPLPVSWTEADVDLADHRTLVFTRPDSAGEPSVAPEGLAGRLSEALDVYQRLPNRRMVVIGEPGSGKSVFAMVLTLQLLGRRQPGERVPVLFPVGSWNPSAVALPDWLAGYVVDNYQLGDAADQQARLLVHRLIAGGLILPVLDGLDEMPESYRPLAIDEINRGLEADHPVILTCRAGEYREAVDNADVLTFAAVLELRPLDRETIVRYLTDTTPGGRRGERWRPVFARLADDPDGPLATVLSSPLMVALARTIYGDAPRDPGELLDPGLRDRAALEDHLLDQLIPATYHDRAQQAAHGHTSWTTADVVSWLTFLARHMTRTGRTDLAWWQLERTIPRTVGELLSALLAGAVLAVAFGPVAGVVAAVALVVFWRAARDGPKTLEDVLRGRMRRFAAAPLVGVMAGLAGRMPIERRIGVALGRLTGVSAGAIQVLITYTHDHDLREAVARGVATGLAVGLLAGLLTVSVRTSPSEVQFDARRGFGVFVRHLLAGMVTGLGTGVTAGALVDSTFGVATGVCVWLGMGLIDGLNVWLDVSTDVTTALSPQSTRLADRLAAVARGVAVGVTVGLAVFLAFTIAYGWRDGVLPGLAFGAGFALADRYVGVGATVWGRYVVAKTWLALRGRLPWRLMAFLDDAHEHDVLRRAGAVYQFRHAQLQHRLARA